MLNQFSSTDRHRNPQPVRSERPLTPDDVERLERGVTRAGRWFAGYLALIGLVSAAWLTVIETTFAEGIARWLAVSAWPIFVVVVSHVAERQAVHPRGATRALAVATAIWFAAYLFAVGPFLRGTYGQQVLPWVIGSLLMSLPFFVAAARYLWRR
ncbi:MAG TPA: hypothetical protein VFH63_09750 [candidate division Zixibacteria bacterium]|nr:hypothetical protein [candidate division Zixibacteria bacterium]